MGTTDGLSVARAYHRAWTSGDYDGAAKLLARDLRVEVPIHEYPDGASFARAVALFGQMTVAVRTLSELGADDEAILLYDMDVKGLGTLRVAEHFTVRDGTIVTIRQIHDTAPIRAAGLAQG